MGNIGRIVALAAVLLTTGCTGAAVDTAPTERSVAVSTTAAAPAAPADPAPLREVERRFGVRLGVYAVNVHTGRSLSYREGEPFAVLSTFKTYAAAALLAEHPLSTGYFDTVIRYTGADLVANSPVTSTRVATGMTVAELCEAAITRSDNTAANLVLEELGGPQAVTEFARSIGDTRTRLDRWETELNTAVPGDPRDTTTPASVGEGYRALVLGDALPAPEKRQLTAWLLASTTGADRIRAGVPTTWRTADKTGTGAYGSANDVAVTWTPDGTPLVMAILTTKAEQNAEYDNAAVAAAAEVAAEALLA
jgi:beta-lactamase class A